MKVCPERLHPHLRLGFLLFLASRRVCSCSSAMASKILSIPPCAYRFSDSLLSNTEHYGCSGYFITQFEPGIDFANQSRSPSPFCGQLSFPSTITPASCVYPLRIQQFSPTSSSTPIPLEVSAKHLNSSLTSHLNQGRETKTKLNWTSFGRTLSPCGGPTSIRISRFLSPATSPPLITTAQRPSSPPTASCSYRDLRTFTPPLRAGARPQPQLPKRPLDKGKKNPSRSPCPPHPSPRPRCTSRWATYTPARWCFPTEHTISTRHFT